MRIPLGGMRSDHWVPLLLTIGILCGALLYRGPAALWTVLVVGALEVSLSFDNAVLNAVVLTRMSPVWQRMFLTVGIVLAVFVVRFALPLLLIAATGRISPGHAWHLAISDPVRYRRAIETARPALAAFGSAFLLLVSASFFRNEQPAQWLAIEPALVRLLGSRPVQIGVGIAGAVTVAVLVATNRTPVALGAVGGVMTFGALSWIRATASRAHGSAIAAIGFFGFLYLEVLDASVSIDGVMGAFAVTTDLIVMTMGLGIGAVFVRSMTLGVVRARQSREYAYLEHGAYYAIATLGFILAASIRVQTPAILTSALEVAIIGAALWSSTRDGRRTPAPIPITIAEQGGQRLEPASVRLGEQRAVARHSPDPRNSR